MSLTAIIMAAGEGKRMRSTLPKVLHEIDGEAMVFRILKKVAQHGITNVLLVCGNHLETIREYVMTNLDKEKNKTLFSHMSITYVLQAVPRGTGDAVRQCLPHLDTYSDSTPIIILNGDTPLIDVTLGQFVAQPSPSLMVTHLENPHGQGRIMTSLTGEFIGIVEEKDATEQQKDIKLVNCGVYSVSLGALRELIPRLKNINAQNEYYLTDICGMLGQSLCLYQVPKELQYELLNVNTPEELEKASLTSSEVFLQENNFVLRDIIQGDFHKQYLQLLNQLSNTTSEVDNMMSFNQILGNINLNPNHYIFVIEDLSTETIVASATLLIEPKFIHDGMCVGHIEDVVVSDQYRGKRIASHIIKLVTYIAKVSENCYKCILDCKPELTHLYGGAGYKNTACQMSVYF